MSPTARLVLVVVIVAALARGALHLVSFGLPVSNDDAILLLMARALLHGELATTLWNQPYNGALDAYLLAPLLAVLPHHAAYRAVPGARRRAPRAARLPAGSPPGRIRRGVGGRRGRRLRGAVHGAHGGDRSAAELPDAARHRLSAARRDGRGCRGRAEPAPPLPCWRSLRPGHLELVARDPGLRGNGPRPVARGPAAARRLGRGFRGRRGAGGSAARRVAARRRGGHERRDGLERRHHAAPALALGRGARPSRRCARRPRRPAGAARGGRRRTRLAARGARRAPRARPARRRRRGVRGRGSSGRFSAGRGPSPAPSGCRAARVRTTCATCTACIRRSSRSRGPASRRSGRAAAPSRWPRPWPWRSRGATASGCSCAPGRTPTTPSASGRCRRSRLLVPPSKPRARRSAYASLQFAGRLALETGGAVVASQAWNERIPGDPLRFRDEVDLDPSPCWVLSHRLSRGMPRAAGFREIVRGLGGSFEETEAGSMTVFHGFRPPYDESRPVPPEAIRVSTGDGAALGSEALDRDPATAWTAAAGLSRGSGLVVRVAPARRLSALVLAVDLETSPLAVPWVGFGRRRARRRGPGAVGLPVGERGAARGPAGAAGGAARRARGGRGAAGVPGLRAAPGVSPRSSCTARASRRSRTPDWPRRATPSSRRGPDAGTRPSGSMRRRCGWSRSAPRTTPRGPAPAGARRSGACWTSRASRTAARSWSRRADAARRYDQRSL